MATKEEMYAEAYRRNLLPPDKKSMYEEAVRRGLMQNPELKAKLSGVDLPDINLPQQKSPTRLEKAEHWLSGGETPGQILEQTGRGLANIPFDILQGGASIINAASQGLGGPKLLDDVWRPVDRPSDTYAQTGEVIGDYLLPEAVGSGAAAILGSAAEASNQDGDFALNAANNGISNLVAHGILMGLAKGVAIGKSTIEGKNALKDIADDPSGAVESLKDAVDSKGPVYSFSYKSATEPVETKAASEEEQNTVIEGLKKAAQRPSVKNIQQIMQQVKPRQDVLAAADRLGINKSDLLESHYSGNEAFKEVQQAFASEIGSTMAQRQREVITKIAEKAASIADLAGSMPDKQAMNEKFVDEFKTIRANLMASENHLFNEIGKAIPAQLRVESPSTIKYLKSRAEDLGGAEWLSPTEKRVLAALSKDDKGSLPTFARQDQQRKIVGAMLKNSLFGSAEERDLEQLYDHLKADKAGVASQFGMGEKLKQANALTVQRKAMEGNMRSLLGKEMTGDVMTKAKKAIMGLMDGNNQAYRELKANIPDRDMRQQIFATALGDAFKTGSRTETDFNLPGFVKFYSGLQRNGTIMQLAHELGPHAMSELHDLNTLGQAVLSAKRYHVGTGRLGTFLDKFDKPNGFLEKLAKHGKRTAVGYAALHIPVVGPIIAPTIIAHSAAKDAAKDATSDVVKKLMGSSVWRQAIDGAKLPEAQQEAVAKALDKKISALDAWKAFYRELPTKDKKAISRVGIVAWLSGGGDEEQPRITISRGYNDPPEKK